MEEYFHSIFRNNIVTNKKFWNFIRPVLASKSSLTKEKHLLMTRKK